MGGPFEQLARVEGRYGAYAFNLMNMAPRRGEGLADQRPGRCVAKQQEPLWLGQRDMTASDCGARFNFGRSA